MKRNTYFMMARAPWFALVLSIPRLVYAGDELPASAADGTRPFSFYEQRAEAVLNAAEEARLAKAPKPKKQISPLQRLAAEIISVYALPEAEQPEALRKVALANVDTIAAIGKEKLPLNEVLNDKLWAKLPKTSPSTRQLVTQAAELIKSEAFQANAKQLAPAMIKMIPDEKIAAVLAVGREQLAGVKISDHPGFKRILDPKAGLTIEDESLRQLAETLLPRFFDKLDVSIKAQIAAGVLRLPPGSSSAQQASAALQNSGPLVQKLFQLVGEKTESPELAEVMALLKEEIQPISRDAFVKVLHDRWGEARTNELFADISKPINAASIGQVHFAKDRRTGEEIVIKVRRPGLVRKFELESQAMVAAAEGTGLENIAAKVVSNIGKEMDLRAEAANLKEGELYIDQKKGIGIAKLIDGIPPEEDILVMKKAPGVSVKKITTPEGLVKRGMAAQYLLENWVTHSVFKNGFFHGDLHTGNMYINLNEKAPNGLGYEFTVLDFGNASHISREEQRGFVRLLSGIALRSPEDTLEALETIGKVPAEHRAAMLADLKKIYAKEPSLPIHKWLSDVMKEIGKTSIAHKVDVPESFIAFQRGKEFLENEIDRVNELLDKVDPKKKLPRYNATMAELNAFIDEAQRIATAKVLRRPATDSMLTLDLLKDVAKVWRNSPYRVKLKETCQGFYRALHQLPY